MTNPIQHEDWDRPENIWMRPQDSRTYIGGFTSWWSDFHRRRGALGNTPSVQFFKELLGRQTVTVTLRCRNWIWCRPEEGWCLYVDKRGPAFHVRKDATADEAWVSFERFLNRAERGLSSYGKPEKGVRRAYGPDSEKT